MGIPMRNLLRRLRIWFAWKFLPTDLMVVKFTPFQEAHQELRSLLRYTRVSGHLTHRYKAGVRVQRHTLNAMQRIEASVIL